MRRMLLGTTALVTAATLAAAASAQTSEPIKMRISGYYTAGAGFVFSDGNKPGQAGNGHRDHAFKQDTEVHFVGETKLDNGLTVGVHFEFEGSTQNGDPVDETWMYFKGGWGELRFGDEDDARKLKAYIAPTANVVFGVNSPYLSFSNNPIGTQVTLANVENDNTKIIYFTPSIYGFSFATSYTPDGTAHASRAAAGGAGTAQNGASCAAFVGGGCSNGGAGASLPLTGGGSNAATGAAGNSYDWSVAGNYDNKFGDVSISGGFGYTEGKAETVIAGIKNNNPQALRFGGVVAWGPFKVGGSWERVTKAASGSHSQVFDLGLVYTIGPFSIGPAWSHGRYDGFAFPGTSSTLDDFLLGARYQLGPGIGLEIAYEYYYYGSGTDTTFTAGTAPITAPTNRDYRSSAIMVGSKIDF